MNTYYKTLFGYILLIILVAIQSVVRAAYDYNDKHQWLAV